MRQKQAPKNWELVLLTQPVAEEEFVVFSHNESFKSFISIGVFPGEKWFGSCI
jgi:hypothetical protein